MLVVKKILELEIICYVTIQKFFLFIFLFYEWEAAWDLNKKYPFTIERSAKSLSW